MQRTSHAAQVLQCQSLVRLLDDWDHFCTNIEPLRVQYSENDNRRDGESCEREIKFHVMREFNMKPGGGVQRAPTRQTNYRFWSIAMPGPGARRIRTPGASTVIRITVGE